MIKFSLILFAILSLLGLRDFDHANHFSANTTYQESKMVRVEGGSFLMGSNEGREHEKPVHKVTVSDFYIGRYEVTVEDYLKFVKSTGKHHPEWLEPNGKYHIETGSDKSYRIMGDPLTNPNHPVVGVSWHDANAYCAWLSEKEEGLYRLPSEAEWEFAARGGNKSQGYLYAGSDSLDVVAWYEDNEDKKTHPVGQKEPNELGINDMSGNVCEWVADAYGEYSAEDQIDPLITSRYGAIIFRGGGFGNSDYQCTVSFRNDNSRMARLHGIGFRVARSK